MIRQAAALLMFLSVPYAQAADLSVSGQQLLSLCTSNMGGDGDALGAAECMGFVVGTAGSFNCMDDLRGFTWDSSAELGQPRLVALVVQYIQENPSMLQGDGHRAVAAALQRSFPCPGNVTSN